MAINKSIKAGITFGILIIYLIVSFGFINDAEKTVNCHDIRIFISDSTQHRFLHNDEIMESMNKNHMTPLGTPVHQINTKKLENFFLQNPYVKTSEVYIESNGILNILLTQRDPMIRVINKTGQSYYIDFEGNIIPTQSTYSARILIVNGNISDHFDLSESNNLFKQKCSSELHDIFNIASFIVNDLFWNAQIEQLYVCDNHEYELIPRIGPHIIQLGTVDNFEQKFKKLQLLYTKGFNNIGWNQYLYINLRYDNQIVCTKNEY